MEVTSQLIAIDKRSVGREPNVLSILYHDRWGLIASTHARQRRRYRTAAAADPSDKSLDGDGCREPRHTSSVIL
jgi:hypothetical protein